MLEAIIGFLLIFLLAVMKVPLGIAMLLVGTGGVAYILGASPALYSTVDVIYETGFAYLFSVIPLFILMGNLIARSGIASELYTSIKAFVGHRRGGLATATIIASGGFGSVCGSSLATVATMSKVSFLEMEKANYKEKLSAGCLAAGGTLGILIPPSTMLIIYGFVTQTEITKLFMAGIFPGILAIILLIGAVYFICFRDPDAGPISEKVSFLKRIKGLVGLLPTLCLFSLVMGGLYFGFFTTTEAAGVGAAGAVILTAFKRKLNKELLLYALIESGKTTAVLFTIIIGALVFTNFINYTGMTEKLADVIVSSNLSPIMIIASMMLVYIFLGMVMEELAIVLLTLPVFFPIVVELGYDPIWFGILVITVIEIGLISPPVGLNLFLVKTANPGVKLKEIYIGSVPFVFANIIRLFFLMAFPAIALYLPSLMS